ncbi:hypothetical protein [Mangrovibacterium sp.]|uniref:hypothetical protein n=1 Tax=Mangrovibacterium sp. TaxID=1961364 RepID=UPI00356A5FC6
MKLYALIFTLVSIVELVGFILGKGNHCGWAALVLGLFSLALWVWSDDKASTKNNYWHRDF